MTRFARRVHSDSDDRGSIVLALLAILILTSVAAAGLVAVVNGQDRTRHNSSYAKALNSAETGLDTLVTQLKAHLHDTDASFKAGGTDANGHTYECTAGNPCKILGGGYWGEAREIINGSYPERDGTGQVKTRLFTITASGTGTTGNHTVKRMVQEQVLIKSTYDIPMYASNDLALNGGAGVSNYDPGNLTNNPTPLVKTPISDALPLNIAVPNGKPGGAGAGQQMEVTPGELSNFSQIGDVFDKCDSNGTCDISGKCTPASLCANSVIVKGASPPQPDPPQCSVNTGVSIPGTPINLDLLPLSQAGIILNADVNNPINTLASGGSIISKVCSENPLLPIIIPTLGIPTATSVIETLVPGAATALAGVLNLLAVLPTLTVPLNFSPQACATQYRGAPTDGTLCANDPSSLQINGLGGTPIYLGTLVGSPTIISAQINDPDGTCTVTGNVTIYGTINCKNIVVPAGSTLTVYYDMNLAKNDVTYKSSVSSWREIT